MRIVRALPARGILLGTVETAKLPAIWAAPAEQKLYSRLRSTEDARRIWEASEELTRVSFPTG